MHTKVWTFIGFTSAVVGLLCYALSSSFIHLFGNWNWLKIFLYGVFCLIICFLILLAMIWNHSRCFRFQVQFAFLVLTTTSVYSFFSDKMINGKPDAYSLISSASFAIMSLSLSRQTQCGFEVDLLYFFLGCLIVQLMKIKLQLFIVGAGFSYSLIIIRSYFPSTPIDVGPENECPEIQDENSVVLHVISLDLASNDIASSMMEQLRTSMKALQLENLHIIDMLLEQEKEYFDNASLMLSERSLEGTLMLEALSPETVNNVQETVKLMLNSGFNKECLIVYSSFRKECLEECLVKQLLNSDNLTIKDVNMEDLGLRIKRWIKAFKVAFKILFPTERQLCDIVFFEFSAISDISFTDVCREFTIRLLNFPNVIANDQSNTTLLFRMLNMYETLHDLIPNFESLFCDQYSVSLRNELNTVLKKLGETIVGTLREFENTIRSKGPGNAPFFGGQLHPLVRFVMNFLTYICDYREILEQVFEDHGHVLLEYTKHDDTVPSSSSSSSSLSVQMERIMEVLESKLEAMFNIFNDPTLGYVYLMNSSRYIIIKTKEKELGTLLGDGMLQRHRAKLRYNFKEYIKSSWGKALEFLRLDNNLLVHPDMVGKSMKKQLKSFNKLFNEICKAQSLWFIMDETLREDIIACLVEKLLPAYRNFIQKFHIVLKLEVKKPTDRYIEYGTEDIKAKLNNMFKIYRPSSCGRKRG